VNSNQRAEPVLGAPLNSRNKFKRFSDSGIYTYVQRTLAALTPGAGSILTHPTTILVLGTDRRAGEPARSDTIMLMRVDPKTHSISQLSIPRDMLVSIPGNGQSKINAAMAWGGTALTVRTVRQFTGIPVNHVVILDMRGFPHMIDAVGGVDVYVPRTISSVYLGGRTVTFKRGWNHMDGARAEAEAYYRRALDCGQGDPDEREKWREQLMKLTGRD